ncbi:MAG: phosphoribosylamine--glycine ligase [Acidobacteria bacterium]|jgi:phosphoribosylamine--glycine ligase|nr:phosphoribosylamine--glycine ligase [Acidobacteriota bacterium]
MKILIIGSGGREHALVWKISQSKRVTRIFAAPGNPGMMPLAERIDIKPTSIIELADFAQAEKIDLTVVGPEQPLALGIVDEFNSRNLKIFGPTQKAAMIETSKSFAKEFMRKNNIPTSEFKVFVSAAEALDHFSRAQFPLVVKADGLAAGKGVYICRKKEEAVAAIHEIMLEGKFGKSGERVVVEDFLSGQEMSFMCVCDGRRIFPLATSMDYKKALEGDKGPNTGGMGAISPAPQLSRELFNQIMKSIIQPTVAGLKFENKEFKGLLYAGLMITRDGPQVLEFNARFGDPESQVVLMRLKSDLVDILEGAADENLFEVAADWDEGVAGCVVLAAKGYPQKYSSGHSIRGLERAKSLGVEVFHAGTELAADGLVTAGGRVLNVCATGPSLKEAMAKVYDGISFITFDEMIFRRDIGWSRK